MTDQEETGGRETEKPSPVLMGKMETELLSQCLEAWMEQEGVTVAGLTEMVGYKSKTSVFRLLKNQCNEQSREAFVKLLAPRLDREWDARFRKAASVPAF